MNAQTVIAALYDLLERVGVQFDDAQARRLGAGMGTIIGDYAAAVHKAAVKRCAQCTCPSPVAPCGHACCTGPEPDTTR